MLNIIKEEREYWLTQIESTNNKLANRCARQGLDNANKKWIKFKKLTKSTTNI